LLRRLRIENLVLIREADLEPGPGLNAITGETGAGKTILAQAIGLLLGAKGDVGFVGPGAEEAYVEAEFDLPLGLLDEEGLEALAELRPEGEEGLVLARRVFADGRTRAYAWGRSAAREDLAAASERLIAMSGQFEQRRLAKASYQLGVLDSFGGEEQLRAGAELRAAWRELGAARRRHEELGQGAAAEEARTAELRALVEDTEGLEPDAEDALRGERERLRHVNELALAANEAVQALAPEEGEGAAGLVGRGERALAAVGGIAPELERAADELRDAGLRPGRAGWARLRARRGPAAAATPSPTRSSPRLAYSPNVCLSRACASPRCRNFGSTPRIRTHARLSSLSETRVIAMPASSSPASARNQSEGSKPLSFRNQCDQTSNGSRVNIQVSANESMCAR